MTSEMQSTAESFNQAGMLTQWNAYQLRVFCPSCMRHYVYSSEEISSGTVRFRHSSECDLPVKFNTPGCPEQAPRSRETTRIAEDVVDFLLARGATKIQGITVLGIASTIFSTLE